MLLQTVRQYKAGEQFRSSETLIVTEAEIIAFALQFDPQPFHVDPLLGQQSMFKGLIASGWHTAAISMRLLVSTGIGVPNGMVGLGVDKLMWPRPVRPGDELHAQVEIVKARTSQTKPGQVLSLRCETLNQNNEVVMTFSANVLITN